jgi:hypothetical protein
VRLERCAGDLLHLFWHTIEHHVELISLLLLLGRRVFDSRILISNVFAQMKDSLLVSLLHFRRMFWSTTLTLIEVKLDDQLLRNFLVLFIRMTFRLSSSLLFGLHILLFFEDFLFFLFEFLCLLSCNDFLNLCIFLIQNLFIFNFLLLYLLHLVLLFLHLLCFCCSQTFIFGLLLLHQFSRHQLLLLLFFLDLAQFLFFDFFFFF